MGRLILMRHAKSSWQDPAQDDHARPLNKRGRASAKAMGQWLRSKRYIPDEVLSSDAQRTGETFIGLNLPITPSYLHALYHASADEMLMQLRAARGATILLLGHNPGAAEMATRLAQTPFDHPRFHDFPTCATLVLDFANDWPSVNWQSGDVVDFAIPRELLEG